MRKQISGKEQPIKKHKEVTQIDIAIETKLHRNTVWSYFRGLTVEPENKKLIEAAIQKLNKKSKAIN